MLYEAAELHFGRPGILKRQVKTGPLHIDKSQPLVRPYNMTSLASTRHIILTALS